ncbi:MAG: Eco57I restriction-modification methylase domain-containing protein [Pseudanabaena sp.]|jgi:hypothetical protein
MTHQAIQELFKQGYNQASWKQFLGEVFANAQLLSNPEILTDIDTQVAAAAQKLGFISLDENGVERQIAVYEVMLADGIILERNRVGLRNVLRKYWHDIDAAFIVYHCPESRKWRLTYVSELMGFGADGEFVEIKTEPKRYTYVLGEGETVRTAVSRFQKIQEKGRGVSLDDVKDVFSVEKLSKMFFDEYKKHYEAFCKYMVADPFSSQTIFKGDEKGIRDFSKKLLGRIVFLYFIQKKGWLGVKVGDAWGKGNFNFLTELFKRNRTLFYQELLSPLFFDTLNSKRADDVIELVAGEPCRIPYLNGGLFEEDDPQHRHLVFPVNLFENLFEFFNQYNFTIYEDDPNDHTVAVDPEMLGHIFENLLEDNKDKGAFYTPKEIVHYMCQESLIEYLTTWFENNGYKVVGFVTIAKPKQPSLLSENTVRESQLELEVPVEAESNAKQINRVLIEKLLKKTLSDDERFLVGGYADKFNVALDAVKICDPAIGSGAFPMGLLHEIFTAKQTLYGIVHGNTNGFAASDVKLNIIQNSIYGVDIERGAVDIARLRFWLSLIVDEIEPKPLPNLDYKIVVGNSLVSKLDDQVIDLDWGMKGTKQTNILYDVSKPERILRSISGKQREFFSPDSNKKLLSSEIRDLKIDLLISQLELMVKDRGLEAAPIGTGKKLAEETKKHLQTLGWKSTISQLRRLRVKRDGVLNFFDWKLDFPEVMNPYLFEENSPEIKTANKQIDSLNDQIDAVNLHLSQNEINLHLVHLQANVAQNQIAIIKQQLLEIESQISIVYSKLNNINSNIVKELDLSFAYNVQSINKSIDEINKRIKLINPRIEKQNPSLGFDIVIGNPPYGANLSSEEKKHFSENYKHQNYQLDTYLLFMERSFELMKINAVNSLIIPNTWLINLKLQKIRLLIVQDNTVLNIVHYHRNVFENVVVDTQAVLLKKETSDNHLVNIFEYNKNIENPIKTKINQEKWKLLLGQSINIFIDKNAQQVINLLKRNSKLLSEVCIIVIGMKPYQVGKGNPKQTREMVNSRIFDGEFKLDETYRPLLRGKDINKYTTLWDKKRWIKYGDHLAEPRYSANFDLAEKIVIRQTSDCLIATLDNQKFVCMNNLHIVNAKDNSYSLKYILAIINSKLMNFYYETLNPEKGEALAEVKKQNVEKLLIKIADNKAQSVFIKNVDKILSLKSEGKDTTALEQQIDNLVYKLYELTYQEVKIIDPEFKLTESEYEEIKIE